MFILTMMNCVAKTVQKMTSRCRLKVLRYMWPSKRRKEGKNRPEIEILIDISDTIALMLLCMNIESILHDIFDVKMALRGFICKEIF